VYYVFGYIKRREYSVVCDVCQRGLPRNADEVEHRLGCVPVPFMRRYGCLVLLAIMGLLVLLRFIDRAT
jgi:hypothetical protein